MARRLSVAGDGLEVVLGDPAERVAWQSGSYVYRPGHWELRRQGYHWVDGHWRAHRHGWVWVPGHWSR